MQPRHGRRGEPERLALGVNLVVASMQPRHGRRGELDYQVAEFAAYFELQCSHGPKTVENAHKATQEVNAKLLQRGLSRQS